MRHVKRYEFLLEAVSPIAHHCETFGNSAIAMRRRVRQPDGSFVSVPILTGDSMRHQLREASSYALLDAVGLLDIEPSLTESALRLLFAGGMITGKSDASAVKFSEYRELVDLIPPLALLGGCAQNRAIPGRLQVDDAVLLCEETRSHWPEWVTQYVAAQGFEVDTCRAHVEEVQRVRMDPGLSPEKRALLTVHAEQRLLGRIGANETASASGDEIGKRDTKSTMMPRRMETIVAGSLFYWGLSATCVSELDVDTLHTMLAAFLANPVVGGKRATGSGRLRPVAARDIKVMRPAAESSSLELVGPGAGFSERFSAHVSARADRVRELLARVDA